MERRRPRLDPLLAEQVNERLAFVLSDRAPRRAQLSSAAPEPEADQPALLSPPPEPVPEALDLDALDELPVTRRFHRRHVGVIAVLVLLGLLGGGWSLLRARPVAVASPGSVVVSTPSASARSSAAASPTAAARIVVHVLGAVKRPGLVTLPEHSRVQDALDAAGGLKSAAEPGELNLAQPLTDGQQVVIGSRDKPVGEVRDGGTGGQSEPDGSASGTTVDLNRATGAQLEQLPGVGPVTAGKIVAWRTEHSRFSRVEELQEVDGIGPKTYAQIAPHVRV